MLYAYEQLIINTEDE